jgi:drug/metabolite transporter (DMT)-like permease
MMLWDSGVGCVAVAAFSFSLVGLVIKLLWAPIPAFQLTLSSSLASWLPVTLALWASNRQRQPANGGHDWAWLTPRHAFLLGLRGVFGVASISALFLSVQLLPLADAFPLYYSSPVFALVMEAAVNRRPIKMTALLGCLFAMGGVVLVARPSCPFPWSVHLHSAPALQAGAGLAAGAATTPVHPW